MNSNESKYKKVTKEEANCKCRMKTMLVVQRYFMVK